MSTQTRCDGCGTTTGAMTGVWVGVRVFDACPACVRACVAPFGERSTRETDRPHPAFHAAPRRPGPYTSNPSVVGHQRPRPGQPDNAGITDGLGTRRARGRPRGGPWWLSVLLVGVLVVALPWVAARGAGLYHLPNWLLLGMSAFLAFVAGATAMLERANTSEPG